MARTFDVSLHADEPVVSGLKRLAGEWIENARTRIEHPGGDRNEDVHAVRTTIKRVRAILRLIRPAISESLFKAENVRLRHAARRLAFFRDAAIGRQTLTRLSASTAHPRDRAAFALVLDRYAGLAEPPHAGRRERAMSDVARALRRSGQRFQRLRVTADDWEVIGPGLERVYRQARKGMKRVFADGDDQAFHRWRSRVKNLYYELQLLAPIRPKRLGRMIAQLGKLQEKIGSDHDLAVLKAGLQKAPVQCGGAAAVKRVLFRLKARSDRLRFASRPLGEAIFDERPGRFVHALERHWKKWLPKASNG
jgi:CHAD domain-containing protein